MGRLPGVRVALRNQFARQRFVIPCDQAASDGEFTHEANHNTDIAGRNGPFHRRLRLPPGEAVFRLAASWRFVGAAASQILRQPSSNFLFLPRLARGGAWFDLFFAACRECLTHSRRQAF
jgi:hypothetical protein